MNKYHHKSNAILSFIYFLITLTASVIFGYSALNIWDIWSLGLIVLSGICAVLSIFSAVDAVWEYREHVSKAVNYKDL